MNLEDDKTKSKKQLKYMPIVLLLLLLVTSIGNVFFVLNRGNINQERDKTTIYQDSISIAITDIKNEELKLTSSMTPSIN